MRRRIKDLLLHSVEVIATLTVLVLVVILGLAQGLVLTNVINTMRLDTYITSAVGVEIVFLLFSLVWVPIWCLLAYNKRK